MNKCVDAFISTVQDHLSGKRRASAGEVAACAPAALGEICRLMRLVAGLPALADGKHYAPETPVFRSDGQPGRLCFDPDIGWNAWPDLDATDSSGWPVPAEKCHRDNPQQKDRPMMKPYISRPVTVLAARITDNAFDGDHPNDEHVPGVRYDPKARLVTVTTNFGAVKAGVGEWIIQSPTGWLYPISDSDFRKKYSPLDPEDGDGDG